ncbi:hypothetical protein K437DRAFT_295902 [Tilletiaria anomala UBC 951]|uniref:Origin recognition complex subunit 3 winged helix C-terminal domain-containing protein n=1 Tax=Tilletiaria anomala (strain ATCC 24038 / CBS 436.72 / UBC 951) TaxID=1037660 RepID=A0A066VNJ0_TILAU|nr:uncharacterized protein K437DRAFT_295902 [Tilletiaria anomala UBC 951]KDN40160.1 hypothetical protein K437DRAFT_295902 [Tilletiaria anomala UBC 951]
MEQRPAKRRKGNGVILQPIAITRCAIPPKLKSSKPVVPDGKRQPDYQRTIPGWRRIAGNGWDQLARWECSETLIELRKRAYTWSVARLEDTAARALEELYQPLLDDIQDILNELACEGGPGPRHFVPVSFLYGNGALHHTSGGADYARRGCGSGLHTILLTGTDPHTSVFRQLQQHLAEHTRQNHSTLIIHAELSAAECWSLPSALRLVLARLSARVTSALREHLRLRDGERGDEAENNSVQAAQQYAAAAASGDTLAFQQLLQLYASAASHTGEGAGERTVMCVLVVPNVASADQQCVSDILQVLLRCANPDLLSTYARVGREEPGESTNSSSIEPLLRGKVVLIASALSNETWLDAFPFDTLRLMEIEHLCVPDPRALFDVIIGRLFMPTAAAAAVNGTSQDEDRGAQAQEENALLPISLGFDVLNTLRQIYEHSEADVDKLVHAMRLAFLHHYTANPLAGLSALIDPPSEGCKILANYHMRWTADFWTMIRVRFARDTSAINDAGADELSARAQRDVAAALDVSSCLAADDADAGTGSAEGDALSRMGVLVSHSRALYLWHAHARPLGIRIIQAIAASLFQLSLLPVAAVPLTSSLASGPAAAETMWGATQLLRVALDPSEESVDAVDAAISREIDAADWVDVLRALQRAQAPAAAAAAQMRDTHAPDGETAVMAEYRIMLERAPSKLQALIGRIQSVLDATGRPQPAAAAPGGAPGLAQPQAEEAGLRYAIKQWLGNLLDTILRPPELLFPLSAIYYTGPSTALYLQRHLQSTPRANIQLALEAPELCFASALERFQASDLKPPSLSASLDLTTHYAELNAAATCEILPDVAQMYALWLEVGDARVINLADWYNVFKQTLQQKRHFSRPSAAGGGGSEGAGPGGAAGRGDAEAGDTAIDSDTLRAGVENDPSVAAFHGLESIAPSRGHRPRPGRLRQFIGDRADMAEEREIQARFAMAIYQLASMGFVRGTQRKAEHVAKAIFDLPVLPQAQP